MATTDDRDYLPAVPRPALLRLYDPFSRLMGARDAQWQLVAQAAIDPGATVLEIGCGTGNVLLLVARVAPAATVFGLDPDARALVMAGRKARRAGATVRLDRGYADRLPYPDGAVDRVLSSFMLHHLPTEQRHPALREAHRVLAPGGRLHLLDFDGTPSGRVGRLLHRPGRAGHGHGDPGVGAVRDALTAAGFAEVVELGHGTTPIGPHTFFRATR
jgi:ubiquinone/menaquinone biosynthesis C-methylase UbiE